MHDSVELLKELSEADGAPGFEEEVRTIFTRRLGMHGELLNDRLGSVVCIKRGTTDTPRVMLDCHLDEVAFMIQHILPSGFLKFVPLGGWWGHTLLSQRVSVLTGSRKIPGIIGSTPPHFMTEDKRRKVLDTSDMFIDIGASSKAEAESWGVRPGRCAVPYVPFTPMANGRYFLGKAFDNRVGCALCIEAVEMARNHPNTLCATGSVQEEVGLRGATTVSRLVEPDVAIVLEGPPADDTPGFRTEECQGGLGRGVQIRAYDPKWIGNPRFVDFALSTAEELGIPHQLAVRHSGATNAGTIHLQRHGIPTVVLGVPVRYIHSHGAVLDIDDYQAALTLTLALVARLDAERVASF